MNIFKKPLVSNNDKIAEHTFKPFHETFKYITFTLTMGLMFPNPATDRIRIILIVSLLIVTSPLIIMILLDMYKCWLEKDIFNIIRHSTIVGPFMGAFLKMFLMFSKRAQAKKIIDEMNLDYKNYNQLSNDLKDVATNHIRRMYLFTEVIWGVLVSLCIAAFPLMAIFMTLFSFVFMDVPTKYMVHDLNRPYSDPEERFESPYFEFIFIYMICSAIICICNYVSYDAFFGLATSHACLKISMLCEKLEQAFQEPGDDDLYKGIIVFIEEQQNMYDCARGYSGSATITVVKNRMPRSGMGWVTVLTNFFLASPCFGRHVKLILLPWLEDLVLLFMQFVNMIQDSFHIWLGTICTSTMIQIGSLLFHISSGYGFDLRYSLFSVTAVIHIFLPCTYVTRLKFMSIETATRLYCSRWERCRARRIRRLMPFLIARAQIPCRITAFHMFDFDMELFVFMMRTSYSMFTLLTS